jgi:hypothetical protein
MLGCSRKKRFVVTTDTLSPLVPRSVGLSTVLRVLASRLIVAVTSNVLERVLIITIVTALTRLVKPEWKVACSRVSQGAHQEKAQSKPRRGGVQFRVHEKRCSLIPFKAKGPSI